MSRQRNLLTWVIFVSWVFIACFQVISVTEAGAETFLVTDNGTSGIGSLRHVVGLCNLVAGPDTIVFDLAYPDTINEDFWQYTDPQPGIGPFPVTESLHIEGPENNLLTINGGYLWINGSGAINDGLPGDEHNTMLQASGFVFEVGESGQDNSAIHFSMFGVKLMLSGGIKVHDGASLLLDGMDLDQLYSVGHPTYVSAIIESTADVKITNSLFHNCGVKSNSLILAENLTINKVRFEYNVADKVFFATSFADPPEWINVDIADCKFLDFGLPLWIDGPANASIINTVVTERTSNPQPGIVCFYTELLMNNVTLHMGSLLDTNPEYHASHLLMAYGSLSMANTVFYSYPSSVPVKPRIALVYTHLLVNENNFVDDASLPNTATGDPGFGFDPRWAPLEGSALIDAGNNQYAVYKDGSPIIFDILNYNRIQGNAVDIGAVETVWSAVAAFSTSLAAMATDDGILVRWNVNHTEDVLAFNIYRNSGGQPELIASWLPVDQREYQDRDIDPGQSYTYSLGVVLKSGGEAVYDEAEVSTPMARLQLGQNHPNPFNPSTTIDFVLEENGQVELAIYDTRGRLVTVLESGIRSAGKHSVTWQGTDSSGRKVGSGTYHYVLKSESRILKRSMVLIK